MRTMSERFSFSENQDEQHLLACARAGDTDAFEKLVRPHRDALYRVTQRILRNREDAEDTVQTALLNAWRNLEVFHGRSRFSSWLTRIAINTAFMRLRANRYKKEVSFDEMAQADTHTGLRLVDARPNPERAFSVKEVLRLVNSVVDRLEPHHRQVFEVSVVQELTGKEAARILDVPVTTVKSRLYRAREIVARSVQPLLHSRRDCAKIAERGAATIVPRTAWGD